MTTNLSSSPVRGLVSTVLDTRDPKALATFYSALLDWPITTDEPDWVTLRPAGMPGLSFQLNEDYVAPTWPSEPGRQQMMMHLDVQVHDLPAAVELARSLGARENPWQPPEEGIAVMLDPAGHVFCLFVD